MSKANTLAEKLEKLKADAALASELNAPYTMTLSYSPAVALALLECVEALQSYTWQDASRDDNIMTDGSVAKDALASLAKALEVE